MPSKSSPTFTVHNMTQVFIYEPNLKGQDLNYGTIHKHKTAK